MSQPSFSPAVDARYTRWRTQIFIITWMAYAGFYLTRKSFSVAKIGIAKDPSLGWTDRQMAWIDMIYLTTYAIGQFIFGMAGDRVGTRRVVAAGLFCSVIAAIAMGASNLVILFGIFNLVQGLCQSCGWAPLAKNMSTFFSRRERGLVMGFWSTNYAAGGLIASALAGYVGQKYGWRYAFYVPAGVLFCVWALFMILQKNKPQDVGLPPIDEYHGEQHAVIVEGETPAEEPAGSWKVIGEVLTNPMVILLACVYLLVKPARYVILNWGPRYVNDTLGSGMAESGMLSAMFELAGPFSALLAGYLSDKVFRTRRMPVCVIFLLMLGIMLASFNFLPATRFTMGASFFLIGLLMFGPDSLIAGAAAIDFGTEKGASTAAGVINGLGAVGAIWGGTAPGLFHHRWGWSGVFAVHGVMVIIGALLLLPKWNAVPPTAEERAAKRRRGFEVVPTPARS